MAQAVTPFGVWPSVRFARGLRAWVMVPRGKPVDSRTTKSVWILYSRLGRSRRSFLPERAEPSRPRAPDRSATSERCQGWNCDFGDVDVVEADDGKIVGDAQAGAVELVQDADGGHVVGAHDGGGHLLFVCGEEALHAGDSAFHGVVPFDDPRGVGSDAALLERGGKCGEARLGGVESGGSADECDISVAQCGEMLHALTDAVVVVDLEQADAWALRVPRR